MSILMTTVRHLIHSLSDQGQGLHLTRTRRRHHRQLRGGHQRTLRPGTKVLLRARADYDIHFGFSLTVEDIDPTYTLGTSPLLLASRTAAVEERRRPLLAVGWGRRSTPPGTSWTSPRSRLSATLGTGPCWRRPESVSRSKRPRRHRLTGEERLVGPRPGRAAGRRAGRRGHAPPRLRDRPRPG